MTLPRVSRLPPAAESQLVRTDITVRDPAGRCPIAGRFVSTERHMLGETLLGYVIPLSGGGRMFITPNWVVERHDRLPDNVVRFRPRGAR